jgi:hypothetical protein
MPHLGYYHDDSIYWVSAKSLAEGNGYEISSLPGEPYQTKYPPLYATLLAVIWKINPSFPANLPAATLLAWLLFPVYLAMLWMFLRRQGFGWREQCVLVLLAGLSPVATVFSFSLMPELLFTALLLGSLMLAEQAAARPSFVWLAVLAGLCGGLAYLTKSIAAPLLFSAPLCFALRKQFKNAGLFFAAMLPAVAGWQWWVATHLSRSHDLVTLYYTNYLGFQLYNVPWRDLPLVMWHNLDGFLMGAGKLLIFDVPFGSKHLERVIAVAAIAGSVRLAKRTRQFQYPFAAVGISGLLLAWHYTPDQRFVFPLYPLLLAGLWTELANVWRAFRISWNKPAFADRAAAAAGAGLLAALAMFVAFTTIFGLARFLPDLFAAYRADLQGRLPAYEWIADHVPLQANLYAYDDPLLYLYTSRKSCSLPIPSKLYYHDDQAGIDKLLDSIPDFAREQQLDYVLVTSDEFYRDLHERGAVRLKKAVDSTGVFQPMYQARGVMVYRYDGERGRAPDRATSNLKANPGNVFRSVNGTGNGENRLSSRTFASP